MLADADDGNGGTHPPRWSSFIGIVISIVGNIVISFALNIQKYAHIRLAREKSLRLQERKQSKRRRRRRRRKLLAAKKGTTNGRNGAVDGLLHPPHGNGNNRNSYNGVEEDLESSWVSSDTYDSPEGGDDEERGRLQNDEEDQYLLESPERSPSKNGRGSPGPPYLRSKWWWTGIILMTIGECGNFLAYGFAPASIVSPLGVVALVSNCLIAPLMLKEPFRRRDLLGVVIAITGVGVVVSSSQPKEEKLTPDQIWWEISQTPFEVYFAITCTLMVLLLYLSNIYGSKIILIDLGLVGLFGGYTALATKGVSSLLSSSLYKIVTYPVFYLLVFILGSTAVLQIKYLSRSLQRFDSTQVIPTQFVLFNIFTVTGSAILYRDFQKADASRLVKFFTGCLLNFLGVYLISSKRQQQNDESDYDSNISETEDEYHFDPSIEPPLTRIISTRPYTDLPPEPILSTSVRSNASRPHLTSSHGPRSPSPLPDEASPLLPPLKRPFEEAHGPPRTPRTPRTPTKSRSPTRRPGNLTITPIATPPVPNPNRSSLSLLTPGPLFVGYQLQAVIADTLRKGVDNILEDEPVSPHNHPPSSTIGAPHHNKKVRKVKSVGASLGDWLRGESGGTLRRKRSGTNESQDTAARRSIRSRVSRSGSGTSASVSGPSSNAGNGLQRHQSDLLESGRRATIALGEGAADEERRGISSSNETRFSPTEVEETVADGGDAPLPDPKSVTDDR
ncbi:hypothetical protein AA313_de0205788 [Arthrobotrys entomopaga]|nr:hypothetical protein AA313_de0205788 [Arthrobotrys entomopaga]